jgi:hypothetical protein
MGGAASVVVVTAPDRSLVALALIALIEGAALVAYAIFDVIEAVRVGLTGPEEVSNAPALVLLVVITAVLGLGLGWVARGWWLARSWARAPFILAQIIAALIGYDLAQSTGDVERVVGIAAIALAVVGLVLSFAPGVSRALGEQD